MTFVIHNVTLWLSVVYIPWLWPFCRSLLILIIPAKLLQNSFAKKSCVLLTCLHTVERYSVLSDELIPDEVVIQNGEPDQRQLRKVDLELETLVKDRIVAWKIERKTVVKDRIVAWKIERRTVVIYGWMVLSGVPLS